jgi:hypothetical protein
MKPEWIKSTFSHANGSCVEVTQLEDGMIGIRDSRAPGGPTLRFTRDEWAAFLAGVDSGEFDHFGAGA